MDRGWKKKKKKKLICNSWEHIPINNTKKQSTKTVHVQDINELAITDRQKQRQVFNLSAPHIRTSMLMPKKSSRNVSTTISEMQV